MKIVGRRRLDGASALEDQGRLSRVAAVLQQGGLAPPPGVYRFDSFEEAERWQTEMMARRSRARRSRKTSPASAGR